MNEMIKFKMGEKQITLFRNESRGVPTIYANMYGESGHEILGECRKLSCKPFHLVSITNLRWDEELSPWPHKPIVSKSDRFTGEAEQYVCHMTEKIIPHIEDKFELSQHRIIAGYSMGGLFALYAPYVTDIFSKSVSASGSVWYPGFLSYVKSHDFLRKPDAIYLSLGDLESHTENQFLRHTENYTNELYSIYQRKSIDTTFEMNPGDHYKDTAYRLARGITWILR